MSEPDLTPRLFEVLKVRATQRGLTFGELAKACGIAWRRGLAVRQKLKRSEATATDIQALVYDLWKNGHLFVEPPAKGQRTCRVWSVQAARIKFPSACAPEGDGEGRRALSETTLRAAYEELAQEYIGGFVPIYRVRREFPGSRETFDVVLRDLNERPEPLIELFPSDPQELTEDQKRDCLKRGDTLLVRMKWR